MTAIVANIFVLCVAGVVASFCGGAGGYGFASLAKECGYRKSDKVHTALVGCLAIPFVGLSLLSFYCIAITLLLPLGAFLGVHWP